MTALSLESLEEGLEVSLQHTFLEMPAIEEGQIFPTLLEFKQALRDWAIEKNFTPHILDSDSHRVRAGCRSSPDCLFRIRANYSEKRGNARVTTCVDVHNCATSDQLVPQTIKRPEVGKLKFLLEAIPKIIDMDEPVTTTVIIDAVKRKYGQDLPLRQAQRVKRALGCKPHGPCRNCRRMGHSKKTCPQLPFSGTLDDNSLPSGGAGDQDGGGTPVNLRGDDRGGTEDQCTRCFQHGHTRSNCTSEATVLPPNCDPVFNQERQNQQSTLATDQVQNDVPIDPNLRMGMRRLCPGLAQTDRILHPSGPPPGEINNSQQEPQTKTAQETRLEAARLMQHAATLMQQAARLNAEAARLTASVANS